MAHLAIQVDLPTPKEPLRNLATQFNAINHGGVGVNVQCSVCRERGRVNTKLHRKGQKFVCGRCL